jgi:ABC-2 type transport system ATP-binding protein
VSGGIRAKGLTRRFDGRVAVRDVDLDVAPGEIFGYLGPNGAGKTTTVRLLTTLLRPTSGTAEVAGIPVTPEHGPDLRRRIGVLTENPGLYLKLSVADNLEFFAGLYGYRGGATVARIARALEAVGLGDRRDDVAGTLSKGLRQRTAIARTLVGEPEVLFLDEPTQGLDPEASVEVREAIEGLRERGVTVFLTTHRLEEAERVCDRVGIVSTRLLRVGTPAELRAEQGAELEVRVAGRLADPDALFASIPDAGPWRTEDGAYRIKVTDPAAAAPAVARAVVAAGADLLRLTDVTPSLEETYLDLIREAEPE